MENVSVKDSDRYPLRSYSDIAFRVYGPIARNMTNILESFQLLLNAGIIIISNAQSLSGMAAKGANLDQNEACFIVLSFVWAVGGMVFGQIRILAKLGYLENFAVRLSVIVMITTMALVACPGPHCVALEKAYEVDVEPIVKTAGSSTDVAYHGQVVDLMEAVYS